jgi:ABC-type multidrug transport system fused ATPase/permease subunit
MRIQHLQQGLGGVKDVKILGRESQFLAEYDFHNVAAARVHQRQFALQNLPRLWLELLGVVVLAALVLTMLAQGKPVDALIPTLGLFAAAAFRLMPSINKVLMAIQGLRFAQPVIETIYGELSLPCEFPAAARGTGPALPFRRELKIDSLGYRYPGAGTSSLAKVSLNIPRGTSVGFIGGSGAGKSTLIDVILGLLTPSEGSISVDGVDIHDNLRGWQSQIGYVPQHIYLIDDSLRRNVAFGVAPEKIDETAVLRAIKAAQLDEFVSQLPDGLSTKVGERGVRLSGGQRQRIGVARALYHDPAVLVLDEATSALDTVTEHRVMESVRNLRGEKTILIVAHRMSTVEHCDSIVRLAHGEVVEMGSPRTMLVSPSVQSGVMK